MHICRKNSAGIVVAMASLRPRWLYLSEGKRSIKSVEVRFSYLLLEFIFLLGLSLSDAVNFVCLLLTISH